MTAVTDRLAEARARRALSAAGLTADGPLLRASSTRNEVYMSDTHVVRINRQLNQRLRREALLCGAIPDHAWSPKIVAYGGEQGADFLIVRRLRGRPLSRAWPTLSAKNRKVAIGQLAEILTELHQTATPVSIPRMDNSPHLLDPRCVSPVVPILMALEEVRSMAFVDPMMIRDVEELVMAHGEAIQDFSQRHLIHGDLTFENILFDGQRVTALVDFEWCRGAPGDLDLDVLLRFCAFPNAHVAPDYEAETRVEDYVDVPVWLAEYMPDLFESPYLAERLCMYNVAFDVQELLREGVNRPVRELGPLHPYRRLESLVEGRSHLIGILNRVQPAG